MLRRGSCVLPRLAQHGMTSTPVAAATASQDVQQPALQQQPLQQQQQRWHSALPQFAYVNDEERIASAVDRQEQAQRRRLQEMANMGSPTSSSRRQEAGASWPSPQQAAEQLRSGSAGGGGCASGISAGSFASSSGPRSSSQPVKDPEVENSDGSNALDWREVVEAVRSGQQDISGQRMLTDTFGWVAAPIFDMIYFIASS